MTRGRRRQLIIDGKTFCDFHNDWHPVADFGVESRNGAVPRYSPRCRVAEQTIRDQDRELDPARSSIINRAKQRAGDLSRALGTTISYHFVLNEEGMAMQIPILRGLIGPGGKCLNCGRHHDLPSEYQLDHREPPRSLTDWAAHHARNQWFLDGCNQKKGRRPSDRDWLDAQQRDWMSMRKWAVHAGTTKGWPPYEPAFGVVDAPPTGLGVPHPDRMGTPPMF